MNDIELLAHAMRRRDEHIKACFASTTSDRRTTNAVAVFICLITVVTVFFF